MDRTALTAFKRLNFTVRTFGHLDCTAPPKIQALPLLYPSSSVCPAAQRDRCHDIRHLTLTPPWRTPAQCPSTTKVLNLVSINLTFWLSIRIFDGGKKQCPFMKSALCWNPFNPDTAMTDSCSVSIINKGGKFGIIAILVHISLSVLLLVCHDWSWWKNTVSCIRVDLILSL